MCWFSSNLSLGGSIRRRRRFPALCGDGALLDKAVSVLVSDRALLDVIDEVFTSCLCVCVRVCGSKVQEEGTSNERRAKKSNTCVMARLMVR
ncbi:hypothetical protein YC2023_037922 [Brassica napus]